MKKTRILFVAPYEEIGQIAEQIAKERTDIDTTIQVGNLENVLPFISSFREIQYDVVISRGGTAKMLTEQMNIPTVSVELSSYDILGLVRTLQNYSAKIAMVCFPDIAKAARKTCALLEYHLDIFQINSSLEAENTIKKLKGQGYSLIVGDTIAVQIAAAQGLNTILAISGFDSVRKAFDDAVQIHRILSQATETFRRSSDLLMIQRDISLAIDDCGKTIFATRPLSGDVISEIREKMSLLKETNEIRGITKTTPLKYSYVGRRSNNKEYHFVLREVSSKIFRKHSGFSIENPSDSSQVTFATFVSCSDVMKRTLAIAQTAGKTTHPVFICGNVGTQKEQLAMAIHWDGTLANAPLMRIDAAQASESVWKNLLYSENSPLLELRYTLLIINLQSLSLRIQKMFYQFLRETNLLDRVRIISISTISLDQMVQDGSFITELAELLSVIHIRMPDLCERKEDIKGLLSLIVVESFQINGYKMAAFEEKALQALKEYDWPNNIPQIRRVLRQSVAMFPDEISISAETIASILMQEKKREQRNMSPQKISGTLEENERQLIRRVLEEEKMNQARAAKRLGISRATLWRKMKKAGEISEKEAQKTVP